MDKAGRRPLLLYPMGVMILILAIIVVALRFQAISLIHVSFKYTVFDA